MDKRSIPVFAVLLALGASGAAVLFWCDPSRVPIYPVCMFHRTTGLLCPGCGGLRALHQLLHGHVATAYHFNPLLVCGLPLVAGAGGSSLYRRWQGQPARAPRPLWYWCALTVTVLFGVLRNLPFAQGFTPVQ
jgi:hypothetical protein